MLIRKAERRRAKLRLAIYGVSGGGKTYSALKLASGLGGKICLIDTERSSGELYAGLPGIPEYDILELTPPYTPASYVKAIRAVADAGYENCIIDSLSHAWDGEGGALDMHDAASRASKSNNSYVAWREVTPHHNALVNAILGAPMNVIATMRVKTAYEIQEGPNGKKSPVKIGLKPVQREGVEYEFTVVLDVSQEHVASATKDRTSLFDGRYFTISEETGQELKTWLESGVSADAPAKPALPLATESQLAALNVAISTAAENLGQDADTIASKYLAIIAAWYSAQGVSISDFSDVLSKDMAKFIDSAKIAEKCHAS